jgi:hypothetical protein
VSTCLAVYCPFKKGRRDGKEALEGRDPKTYPNYLKYCKRVYFRRRHASHPEEDDGMTGIFAAWKTTAVKRRRPLPADRRVPEDNLVETGDVDEREGDDEAEDDTRGLEVLQARLLPPSPRLSPRGGRRHDGHLCRVEDELCTARSRRGAEMGKKL